MVLSRLQRKSLEEKKRDTETLIRVFGPSAKVTIKTAGTNEPGRTTTLGERKKEIESTISKASQPVKEPIPDFVSLATGTARQTPDIKKFQQGFESKILKKSVFLPNVSERKREEVAKKISGSSVAQRIFEQQQKLKEKVELPVKTKGKFNFRVLKEILPIVNTESRSAYNKIRTGRKADLNNIEKLNIVFDVASILTLGSGGLGVAGIKTVGKLISKSGVILANLGKIKKLGNVKKVSKIPNKRNLLDKVKNLNNIGKISTVNFAVSVADDVGFGKRMFEAGKEYYKVDDGLLSKTAKQLKRKNKEALLTDYNGFVAKELRDGKLNWRDYANFVGITTGSDKHIRNAQTKFSKFLINSGFSSKETRLIVGNLENARRSRAIGQLFGLTKIEISSDKLVDKLISKGLGKRKAITIGVAREGVSTLVTETYIQGTDLKADDLFLAVALGVPFSLWASKTKFKKVPPKVMKKATNKIVNKISKQVGIVRSNKYVDKMIKQNAKESGAKLNKLQVKNIRAGLSNKEKNILVKDYIKNVMLVNRKRVLRPSKIKQKILLRDPIVNIFDPFEFLGDKVQDINDFVKKKIVKSFRKKKPDELSKFAKVKKKPRTKVSKVKAKVKAKVKTKLRPLSKLKPKLTKRQKLLAKIRAKARSKAIARARAKAKAKAKVKPKPRPKPKTKVKPKPKPRPKPKTKVKPKPKPRPKPKTKVKTLNLQFWLGEARRRGERVAFNLLVTKNNKQSRLVVRLPKNRAKERIIRLVNADRIDKGEIFPIGTTKKKDISNLSLKKIINKIKKSKRRKR